ncbi:hypothetical protein O6H91_09G098700 [Diphasiastrum complanatum]|uniref:Uncharacterized protein n=1 Tax=Diphasiastrum complanatum TaxID=34168 RepID=A0ACC2CSI0_DIPCM|nr:hypothetical protein O6H91_Y478900 [Diphasiastrum complanatum]KAJ7544912.1 hypothetical protein O6H91_09G098700 [Diphasiastrum complanatum]
MSESNHVGASEKVGILMNAMGDSNHVGFSEKVGISMNAGAVFVLESKGTWLHAAYHLTTSVAGPGIISLPFAFATLGWGPGAVALIVGAAVTFYGYNLLSRVLEESESRGRRHLRYRELAADILGRHWSTFFITPLQFSVCLGATVFSALLCGQSLKGMYSAVNPTGGLKLYHFIIFVSIVIMIFSQMPSFHSLRYFTFISSLLALIYSLCIVCGSVIAGHSTHAPTKNYSLSGYSSADKLFNAFNGLSVIATAYGTSIIPEIQATVAPPVGYKMYKALLLCYAVVLSTFFPVAISGYWAFGNQAVGNVFQNLSPNSGPSLVPNWLLFVALISVTLQLLAIALVYAQPTFEVIEGRWSDVKSDKFSLRNVLPRVIMRSMFVAVGGVIAAMIPFFGDLNALVGAVAFIPLDFILPFVLYNAMFKPSPKTLLFWIHASIIVVSLLVSVIGCIAAVRHIVQDASTYKLFANVSS